MTPDPSSAEIEQIGDRSEADAAGSSPRLAASRSGKRLRLLVLNHEYPPLGGGASPVTRETAKEFVRRGHDVDVLTMGRKGLPAFEVDDGVRVHRVPCLRSKVHMAHGPELATYVMSASVVGRRLAAERDFDLIHSHFFVPCGFVARHLQKRFAIPYVVTAHGSDVPDYNPDRFAVTHRLIAPMWHDIVRHAAAVTSPSQSLADLINRHAKSEVAAHIIPNGIASDWIEPGEKQRSLLVVSRLFERKGVHHLLQALQGTPIGMQIHIVGDGPHRPALERLAESVPDPVRFHGWMDNGSQALRELYRRASVFVFPSSAENFPICLLEAMLSGCAVVASGIDACHEVLGDTAHYFEVGDVPALRRHLLALSQNEALARRYGDAARERTIRQFSWTRIAEAYENVFLETAERRARR